MYEEDVETKMAALPDDLKREVADYVDFLLQRYGKSKPGSFGFEWEGGLSELRDEFTSVGLQHKALEWR